MSRPPTSSDPQIAASSHAAPGATVPGAHQEGSDTDVVGEPYSDALPASEGIGLPEHGEDLSEVGSDAISVVPMSETTDVHGRNRAIAIGLLLGCAIGLMINAALVNVLF